MKKVLAISGHNDIKSSNANRYILNELDKNLDNFSIRYLDELYPDFNINVEKEQEALLAADIIILQFPFHWYSFPALLKKWIDDVLSYNFAYGSKGDKLQGKEIILSFTVGGPAESYTPLGYNHFTIEELIKPIQQTVYLTGMIFQPPIYTHNMVYIPNVYNKLEEVRSRALEHADKLISAIKELQQAYDGDIKNLVHKWFKNMDELPEKAEFFLDYLTPESEFQTPEQQFKGLEEFEKWYQSLRRIFNNPIHTLEHIVIKDLGENNYLAEIRVRLQSETALGNPYKGVPVNMLINQEWHIFIDKGALFIKKYIVTPVS